MFQKMDPRHWAVLCAALLVFCLCLCGVDGENKVAFKGYMGSSSFCKSSKGKTQWLSEDTSALIIGKGKGKKSRECRVVIGAAVDSSKSVRLRVHFDSIYFDSCGVKLQINQSSTNDFSSNNKEMFMSGCNRDNPGPLYTQPQRYLMISLTKADASLEGYNFRLNVSVAEHLPVTGAPLRAVIIVSFVCFVVVVGAAYVLFKYANHLSMEWGEERREENMDRAIQLYNSSSREASGENDSAMALVEPGTGLRCRQPRPEIAFVHQDGRVLRFQPRMEEENGARRRSETGQGQRRQKPSGSNHRRASPKEEPTHFFLSFCRQDRQGQNRDRGGGGAGAGESSTIDNADTASVGGVDLPPPYEEALAMPLLVSDNAGGACDSGGDDGGSACDSGACGGGDAKAGEQIDDEAEQKCSKQEEISDSGGGVSGGGVSGGGVSGGGISGGAHQPPADQSPPSPGDGDYMNYVATSL